MHKLTIKIFSKNNVKLINCQRRFLSNWFNNLKEEVVKLRDEFEEMKIASSPYEAPDEIVNEGIPYKDRSPIEQKRFRILFWKSIHPITGKQFFSDLEAEVERRKINELNLVSPDLSVINNPDQNNLNISKEKVSDLKPNITANGVVNTIIENQDNIKKEALNRLEIMQELLQDFNEGYQNGKTDGFEEVMKSEDYIGEFKKQINILLNENNININISSTPEKDSTTQFDNNKDNKNEINNNDVNKSNDVNTSNIQTIKRKDNIP